MMNGRAWRRLLFRISWQRRKPSMFGMRMSEMTASTVSRASICRASTPSAASSVVWPSASSVTRRRFRLVAMASTMRTWAWPFLRRQLGYVPRELARVYGFGDVAFAAGVECLLVVTLHRKGGERDDADVAGA